MFKGRHFDQSVILLCVRWYLAYGLSLRDLKEMMANAASASTIRRRRQRRREAADANSRQVLASRA